jgi:hypothetical protein
MNIRFYNGLICTMSDRTEIIEEEEIWVQGNKIIYVCPYKHSKSYI